MPNLNRDWKRRRWILALLFILLMTVSMMSPTQALSGVVTASVAVMEAFNSMAVSDAPSPGKPVAGRRTLAEWFDEALAPDFQALLGDAPPPPPGNEDPGLPENPSTITSSAGSSQTTSPQSGGFGYGASGWPGYQGGGASGSGFGGLGEGGIPIEALAGTDEALTQQMALLEMSAGDPASALDSSIGDSPSGPSLPGDSAGGSPAGSDGGGALPGGINDPALSGTEPSQVSGAAQTPYADGSVPAAVMTDLLDDLNLPDSDSVGNTPGTSRVGFDLAQVPEPSTLLLMSLGLAALRRRSRRGHCSRNG